MAPSVGNIFNPTGEALGMRDGVPPTLPSNYYQLRVGTGSSSAERANRCLSLQVRLKQTFRPRSLVHVSRRAQTSWLNESGTGFSTPGSSQDWNQLTGLAPARDLVSAMTDNYRPIRRIPSPPGSSPQRHREIPSSSYVPKSEGKPYKSKYMSDGYSFYKSKSYNHKGYSNVWWNRPPPQNHHKMKERVRYEARKHGGHPPRQKKSKTLPTKAVLPTSWDKNIQFTDTPVEQKPEAREWISETIRCPIFGNDSQKITERDPREPEEVLSTTGQTVARERAIQTKRKQIDELYYQECEIFVFVVKKLIAKDPTLEVPIQSSLQENIRDIGARCLKKMETFIEEYDSTELP